MFKTFFFSEIKNAFKQPMVYIFLFMMTLMVFAATCSEYVSIGGVMESVYKNSPHVITTYCTIMTMIGLFFAAAFFNGAALKDYVNHFNELLFSAPISKKGYFFGRFFGALFLSTVPLMGVLLGVVLGSIAGPLFGWIDADYFGSFYFETFVNNYLLFILPNMFVSGALIFAIASQWKNTVLSFVAALGILMLYMISQNLLSDIDNETTAALLDVFGIGTYFVHAQYFTTAEMNTLSPPFYGILLYNRLIWIGFGIIVLMTSYFNFSFKEKKKAGKATKADHKIEIGSKEGELLAPVIHAVFNARTSWAQFRSFFFINFMNIIKHVSFKILVLFCVIILISNLIGGFEYMGLKSYPLTYKLMDVIGGVTGMFIAIILIFFSGELVWRDREVKINEVVDASPHIGFISLLAKMLSLVAVLCSLYLVFIVAGASYQLIMGYTRIELLVYIQNFFLQEFFYIVIWSAVAILLQSILNNKYTAYFACIVLMFFSKFAMAMFQVKTKMLAIAAIPSVRYSDMNAFGPGLEGALWFNAYWFTLALVCIYLAGFFWKRGVFSSMKERIQKANKQLTKRFIIGSGLVFIIWVLVAGNVFYNTKVLNTYKTSKEMENLRADYEKKYKKYEGAVVPKTLKVKYFIDIFPYRNGVNVKAEILLKNTSYEAIDTLYFGDDEKWNTNIDIPGASLVYNDTILGFQKYVFNESMQPGDSLLMVVTNNYESKGFENDRGTTSFIANGSFFNNKSILPVMGYQEDIELADKHKRKKHGLLEKERMPKLETNCEKHCSVNYMTNGQSDFIEVETVISTVNDQVAIAPGSLLKEWKEDDRNYYHYKLDHPSIDFYSFMSARYKVKRRKWKGIDLEVYYDEYHGANTDKMLLAMERALAYYTENFGPYMHKQCRIIEFPRYQSFAQAFPGTMPYSEAIGFVIDLEGETKHNVIDAVIAHEIGHQWWAHQVIGAKMQGGTFLSEAFSEYSSLMTMKQLDDDPIKMREFLKYSHHRYLRGRNSEKKKENPIYKVENQGYIHYGKGSVILYALQDYIGEDSLNAAMRSFRDEFAYQGEQYPTSLDFIRHLEPRVPDTLNYLITDWLKEITLYDNRVKEAQYTLLDNGRYEVRIAITSKKLKADSLGTETDIAMNDWIDIGLFSDKDEKHLFFNKRLKITEPETTFTFEVDSLPAKAGVDPKRLLIDRVFEDNIKVVEEKG